LGNLDIVFKNRNKIFILILITSLIILITTSTVYAQGPTTGNGIEISDVMKLENISVIASAFVFSAIGWAILGWQKKRRTANTPIDPIKLLKTIAIGIGVGVLAFGYTLLFGDGTLEHLHITTFDGYKQLLMWTFPAIVTIIVVLKRMFPDLGKSIESISKEPEPIDDPSDLPPGKEITENTL